MTRPTAKQAADVEVLARLRHHALVGGDHERTTSMPRAGQHVLHKALVPGDVDKADAHFAARSRSAKPMSMVMPRRFLFRKRSASMPVSARTRAVLP